MTRSEFIALLFTPLLALLSGCVRKKEPQQYQSSNVGMMTLDGRIWFRPEATDEDYEAVKYSHPPQGNPFDYGFHDIPSLMDEEYLT